MEEPGPVATWRAGTRLGNYTLVYELARGGMGEIWLARQAAAGGVERNVVIKRLIASGDEDPSTIHLFLDEARIAAQLSHPNVVQIFDFAQQGTSYYLVMEYLPGETLSKTARVAATTGRALDPSLSATVVAQAAAGLGYAHQRKDSHGRPLNIVHRDVSPQNILLTYDGHVKVLDFGIASAEGRLSRTRSGTVRGKLSYMAPEQAMGTRVDARADVFSLGVVLFELLTGTRLYGTVEEVHIFKRLAAEEPLPGPLEVVASVPRPLDAIVRKALAIDPTQRYANGRELAAALDAWLLQQHSPARLETLMHELFQDRIEAHARLVASSATAPRDTGAPELPSPASNPTMPGGTRPRDLPRLARRWPWVVGAVAAVAVLAAGAATLFGGGERSAELTVTTQPADATVLLDDQPCAPPCARRVLSAGKHRLTASLPGHRSASQEVELDPGERRSLFIALAKEAAVVAPPPVPVAADASVEVTPPDAGVDRKQARGFVTVDTTPWTRVFHGRTLLGETPVVEAPVPAGHLRLRLVNEQEKIDQLIEVDVRPNQTTVKKLSL